MLISATLVCCIIAQTFEHAQFAHHCGLETFQNFKTYTDYLELHKSCKAALHENSICSNFQEWL